MSSARKAHPEQARLETAGSWLMRLQEDSLSEAELSEWIEWCERDPQNLRAFDELHALYRASGEQLEAERKPLLQKRVPLWTALAASILVLIGAAVLFFANQQWSSDRIANNDLVRTPVAQNQPATLPDGSHLEVGGRSSVSVDFTAATRRLQLRDGEAFFAVKHDVSRPFIVEVGDLKIVAVGTAFNVRRAGTQVAVTVQEGVVEVSKRTETRGASGQIEPMRVQAGQQLVADARSGKMQSAPVDPDVALAWRSGRLEFTGDSLYTVISSVNRYAARPITLGDPRVSELTFTGTVFYESIDAWLDSLQQVFPVVVDRSRPDEIVLLYRSEQR